MLSYLYSAARPHTTTDPTDLFTVSEPQNLPIDVYQFVHSEGLKWGNCRSGTQCHPHFSASDSQSD